MYSSVALLIHIVAQPPAAASCVYLWCPVSVCMLIWVWLSLCVCLYLRVRVCVSVSGGLSTEGPFIGSVHACRVCVHRLCSYLSLSVLDCVGLCVGFMCPHEESVAMCGCVSMSLCPYPRPSVSVSDAGPMSAHVCFGPFHVSVCVCVLWECVFVCVPEHLCPRPSVSVFIHDWVSHLEGGLLCVRVCLYPPASPCCTCVSCLPHLLPSCLCPPLLPGPAGRPLSASAVFVCVYTRERRTMAHEPQMVYMFLMVGEKNLKKDISLLVEMI